MKRDKAKLRSRLKRVPVLVSVDELELFDTIIDVRSPEEFAKDHIPGAINCPVLYDDEHAAVGTLYCQTSPFEARKLGAAYVSKNIAAHLENSFSQHDKQWRPVIYCWRGGQRSGSLWHILKQIGWQAGKLEGGYKVWRRHVLDRLQTLPLKFTYRVVTGLTGCAKSYLLEALEAEGAQVLHLEALASHKGSVLGGHPDSPQPSQPAFETALYTLFNRFDPEKPVYIESESRRIGSLYLPEALFSTFSNSPHIIDLEVPIDERVALLLADYRWVDTHRDWLMRQLDRIASMHSKKTMSRWMTWAEDGDFVPMVRELLEQHYDPLYRKSHNYQLNGYQEAQNILIPHPGKAELQQLARSLLEKNVN